MSDFTPNLTRRERLAIRLLGWATWALPAKHPSISAIYSASWDIEAAADRRAALKDQAQ